jgi:mannose-6-phosphate isomerase-like protein (cupin superfamily)
LSEFILMLTRDDVTVPNARDLLREVLSTPVRHVGFKDVGLPLEEMRALVREIRAAGRSMHLEVVSLTEEEELRSAQVAIELEVDYLIGGTRWSLVRPLLEGTGIRYFPYPGTIVGHPAQLEGSVEQIVADAERMGEAVDGINLLAYRHVELDGAALLEAVQERVSLPVIAAGSVNSLERVRAVAATGAWAFTIGAAALDLRIVAGGTLARQLEAVLEAAGDLRRATVVRERDARSFLEGPEHCREYLNEERMWFGTSTLLPGQTGGLDAGHARSTEVFYCARGHALVHDGDAYHELRAGDALLIPPGVPHTISNVGGDPVLIVWAGAPGA